MIATLPRRAFLGAELPGDHEAFTDEGVRIAAVAQGSMAARAGLASGDVLVALAGLPVRDLGELAAALRRAGATQRTELAYLRDGERRTASVDVARVPEEPGSRYEDLAGLRTIETAGSRALVLIVQGIACESIEAAPYAPLAAAWTRAGFATLRFDKRGVGDSDGSAGDFAGDLADARAVAAHARSRSLPLVIFGHSVGGIIAAQLADLATGIIVYGAPVMRWLDCLRDTTRRQLAGAPDVERHVAAIDELASAGRLSGRSAAYHAQLDRVDVEAAWRAVRVPVLVVRGEYDWVVRAEDQARVPGAEIVDVAGVDHVLGVHADREASVRDYGSGAIDDRVAIATLPWLDRLFSRS